MAELIALPAWSGLALPFVTAGATLAAPPATPMLVLAPLRGRQDAVAEALGASLPGPGRAAAWSGGRIIWFGLDQWLLAGAAATPDLETRLDGLAAVSDQSDNWTVLSLGGPDAAAVLARLAPIDLDGAAFPPDAVARTQLRHMMCLLARAPDGFEIMVMRSFTRSAVHDLQTAMRAVAARCSPETGAP